MDVLFEELKQHVWESFRQIAEANQRLADTNQRLAEIPGTLIKTALKFKV